MPARTNTWGGLLCQLMDNLPEGKQPELAVILCHGYGAPGTDLVPLAGEMINQKPELAERVQWIFPAAPLSLESLGMPGGRAWWHLDINRLVSTVESGNYDALCNDMPVGLEKARDMLTRLIEEVKEETKLPASRIVLGGFSQGAMLSTDVSLRLSEDLGALVVLSGTLVCVQEWKELISQRKSRPVLQSHGRADDLLPFDVAVWLRDLFTDAGWEVDFLPFDGGHTVSLQAVQHLTALVDRMLREEESPE